MTSTTGIRSLGMVIGLALALVACDEGTEEGRRAQPATPRAWTGASAEASPRGAPLEDLIGVWTGDVVEPGTRTTWSARITIGDCVAGALCSSFRFVTLDYHRTGHAFKCGGDLRYERSDEGIFLFSEYVSFDEGVADIRCADAMMFLTPMRDAGSLAVEEQWDGHWLSYGVLRRTASP